ncbi:adhesion G-protein coupled receptor G4-like isoform X2 [Polypterus senegalus]|uniref:adhesion G-protein coupled receptor G4-like isoform X2 n=1 Tax=Polypterus senegalus TaxID=55291 RepID=UPI001964ED68|nr:adhesion G-protein coupled receptor G4-like isoform X2 [Polypterus senegalus]
MVSGVCRFICDSFKEQNHGLVTENCSAKESVQKKCNEVLSRRCRRDDACRMILPPLIFILLAFLVPQKVLSEEGFAFCVDTSICSLQLTIGEGSCNLIISNQGGQVVITAGLPCSSSIHIKSNGSGNMFCMAWNETDHIYFKHGESLLQLLCIPVANMCCTDFGFVNGSVGQEMTVFQANCSDISINNFLSFTLNGTKQTCNASGNRNYSPDTADHLRCSEETFDCLKQMTESQNNSVVRYTNTLECLADVKNYGSNRINELMEEILFEVNGTLKMNNMIVSVTRSASAFDGLHLGTDLENDTNASALLESLVVGVIVENASISNLSNPLIIRFFTGNNSAFTNMTCVFWDETEENGAGDWSVVGCQTFVNNSTVTCKFSHLSYFAVLVSPGLKPSEQNAKALTYISYIGCGISSFCICHLRYS